MMRNNPLKVSILFWMIAVLAQTSAFASKRSRIEDNAPLNQPTKKIVKKSSDGIEKEYLQPPYADLQSWTQNLLTYGRDMDEESLATPSADSPNIKCSKTMD